MSNHEFSETVDNAVDKIAGMMGIKTAHSQHQPAATSSGMGHTAVPTTSHTTGTAATGVTGMTAAPASGSTGSTGYTGSSTGASSGITDSTTTGTSSGITGSTTGISSGMTGTSNTGSVGTTTATTGVSGMGQGHAHVHGTDQYASTTFQHNAQVHFSGHQTDATVTTENQATNVQVPGQHITATLPAKQVIVEVPERQVEVDLPARNIQLENNPEIEVTTKPNIRSVGAAVVGEAEAALGMGAGKSSTAGVTGTKTASNY